VAEQYRQQIEVKLHHITLTEQDSGEELWERCKTIINSIAEEVMGIMEPANRGTWFDDECQAATQDKNKVYKDAKRIWYQKLHRRVQRKEKKKQFIKQRKRMDECGIRTYGIAEETT
jgi:hypothetical protein